MKTIQHLLDRIEKYELMIDVNEVSKAYQFAEAAHEGQKRFSGEPYIVHPVEVAYKLLDFNPDQEMVVAALLHDVSEDTSKTLDDIETVFGVEVRKLVYGLEKLSKVRVRVNEPHIDNLRKMFMAMSSDLRVILIKLCDRWHNMETLQHVRPDKQYRIAKETLEIYVPIASRLGIYVIKSSLEDLAFKHLDLEAYNDIDQQLASYHKSRSKYMLNLASSVKKFLNDNGVVVRIEARIKTHYSIYRKLKRKGKNNIDDIFDVFAIRVIIPEENNSLLYQVLGLIHSKWVPLASRFKDYVAIPKANGYRSLHTTIMGLGVKSFNQPVEIQIRTENMHREAEFGIASHWIYKETTGGDVLKPQMAWIQALENLQLEVQNDQEFITDLQSDLFNDRIFVLTPNGDVRDLPVGATPIDFAYTIHTDVGHAAVMAKVNGKVVPLDTELLNGQVVEILTKKGSEPSQFWLSFVKTNEAKNKIKNFFKNKDADKNLKSGRDLMNKYLERIGKSLLDTEYSILKKYGGKRLTVKEREDVLIEIGQGMVPVSSVIKSIFPLNELLMSNQQVVAKTVKQTSLGEVVIDGQSGISFKFGVCCKPHIPDEIVGYLGRNKAVTVHKKACKMLLKSNPARFIEVSWASNKDKIPKYRINIVLELQDRVGILRDIANVISEMDVNIVDLSISHVDTETSIKLRHLIVEIVDYDQLEILLNRLERIPNILSVKKMD